MILSQPNREKRLTKTMKDFRTTLKAVDGGEYLKVTPSLNRGHYIIEVNPDPIVKPPAYWTTRATALLTSLEKSMLVRFVCATYTYVIVEVPDLSTLRQVEEVLSEIVPNPMVRSIVPTKTRAYVLWRHELWFPSKQVVIDAVSFLEKEREEMPRSTLLTDISARSQSGYVAYTLQRRIRTRGAFPLWEMSNQLLIKLAELSS